MPFSYFSNYLKSNKNIPIKQIPFYTHWAKKFTEFSKNQSGLFLPDKLIDPFLKQLGTQHEQWQVDQAREAINLYCYFLTVVRASEKKFYPNMHPCFTSDSDDLQSKSPRNRATIPVAFQLQIVQI